MKEAITNEVRNVGHHVEEGAENMKERAESLQRDKYGGFNIGAAFYGWLVANSVSVLLIALLSALGTAVALTKLDSAQQAASQADTIGIVGAIGLLVVLGIAYYAGGYVAGRLSRFDGGRQGFGTWLFGITSALLLAAAGTIFGAKFNLLSQLNVPGLPVDGSSFTIGGVITLLAILVVTALAAIVGGKAGNRYHQKVDVLGQADESEEMHGYDNQFAHQR
jgi:hypothetical protein